MATFFLMSYSIQLLKYKPVFKTIIIRKKKEANTKPLFSISCHFIKFLLNTRCPSIIFVDSTGVFAVSNDHKGQEMCTNHDTSTTADVELWIYDDTVMDIWSWDASKKARPQCNYKHSSLLPFQKEIDMQSLMSLRLCLFCFWEWGKDRFNLIKDFLMWCFYFVGILELVSCV